MQKEVRIRMIGRDALSAGFFLVYGIVREPDNLEFFFKVERMIERRERMLMGSRSVCSSSVFRFGCCRFWRRF